MAFLIGHHRYFSRAMNATVPVHDAVSWQDMRGFQKFFDEHKKLFIITGAGLSTESGIPDYRSKDVGRFSRSKHKPMLLQEFLQSKRARQRFWARNYAGWEVYQKFQPNTAHIYLNTWEKFGRIQWLVTQNVDGLHSLAGSRKITELHGSMHR